MSVKDFGQARLVPAQRRCGKGNGKGIVGAVFGDLVLPIAQFVDQKIADIVRQVARQCGPGQHCIKDGEELVEGFVPVGALRPGVHQRFGNRAQDRQRIDTVACCQERLGLADELFERRFIDVGTEIVPMSTAAIVLGWLKQCCGLSAKGFRIEWRLLIERVPCRQFRIEPQPEILVGYGALHQQGGQCAGIERLQPCRDGIAHGDNVLRLRLGAGLPDSSVPRPAARSSMSRTSVSIACASAAMAGSSAIITRSRPCRCAG